MDGRRSAPATMPWHARSADLAWRYGNWLADEAHRVGLHVVAARPWGDLIDRVLGALTA